MTKLEAIKASKQFRKNADELLQRMKEYRTTIYADGIVDADNQMESYDQHVLSIRDLESCIMRQGMALKYVGTPDPYPESRNPESSVVAPTADGLKL